MNIKNISFFLLLALLCYPGLQGMTAAQRAAARAGTALSRTQYRFAGSVSQLPSNVAQPSCRAYSSFPEAPKQKPADWSTKGYQQSLAQSWAKLKSVFPNKPTEATTDLLWTALKSKKDIQDLFDKGLINSKSRYGKNNETILHIAARRHVSPEIMTLLIDKGANVSARNKYGDTPLHNAVQYENLEAVKLLVAKGANPNTLDKPFSLVPSFLHIIPGESPLYLAQKEDEPSEKTLKIIEFLEPLTKKSLWFEVTPEVKLTRAIMSKQAENVKQVLTTNKFSKNELNDALIRIPLYIKLYREDILADKMLPIQISQLLIDAGANVNAQTSWSKETPLHKAVESNNPALVGFLLKHGANPIARDVKGKTPLNFVKKEPSENKLKIIELLGPQQERAYEIDRSIRDSK